MQNRARSCFGIQLSGKALLLAVLVLLIERLKVSDRVSVLLTLLSVGVGGSAMEMLTGGKEETHES